MVSVFLKAYRNLLHQNRLDTEFWSHIEMSLRYIHHSLDIGIPTVDNFFVISLIQMLSLQWLNESKWNQIIQELWANSAILSLKEFYAIFVSLIFEQIIVLNKYYTYNHPIPKISDVKTQ